MATSITSSHGTSIRGLNNIRQLDKTDANNVLDQLKAQIAGKRGVLTLITSKNQDMVFKRKSWYQAIERRSTKMQDTAEALKTLYTAADLSPSALMQLETYLSTHKNRVGGTSLSNLIEAHLNLQTSKGLVKRVLPREAKHNYGLGSSLFGNRNERRKDCVEKFEVTVSENAENLIDRDQRNSKIQRDWPDLNPNYVIANGPNDASQLVGISRSANATLAQQFDLTKPVVIFFGGSHGNVDDYGYPAAAAAGPDHNGGLNFLSVDYRGFGRSGDVNPTPNTITEDAVKVYEHAKSLGFRTDQIILRGYSLGATAAARIHAIADLQGEQLMGVVYDRPMASAADTAGVVAGWIGKTATKAVAGDFGADRYLKSIHKLGSGDMSRALVIADNGDELGPRAKEMAQDRGIPLHDLKRPHEAHWHANGAFNTFLEKIMAQAAKAPIQANLPSPINPPPLYAAAPQADMANAAPVSVAQAKTDAEPAVNELVHGLPDGVYVFRV
jgi:pimeloyl-ACP methyl ester carboxylesterase